MGIIGDTALDPFNYILHKKAHIVRIGSTLIVKRAKMLEATDFIKKASMDEYASYRSLYFQKNRE